MLSDTLNSLEDKRKRSPCVLGSHHWGIIMTNGYQSEKSMIAKPSYLSELENHQEYVQFRFYDKDGEWLVVLDGLFDSITLHKIINALDQANKNNELH